MKGLTLLSSMFSLFFHKRDYVDESEQWFDDVWKHIKRPAKGEGEFIERDGRIFRQFRIDFGNGVSGILTDEMDEGAYLEDVKIGWWQGKKLEFRGVVTAKYNQK